MQDPQAQPVASTLPAPAENPVVTPQEFAQKVKAKYPQYGSMSDGDLVGKVLAKHPEYGNNIKGYAQSTKPGHQGAIITQGGNPTPKTTTDKVANFIGNQSSTIGGIVGGLGGIPGGLPGMAAGASAGGAAAEAFRQKTMGEDFKPKSVLKEGGIQGAYELGGGLIGKGIAKTASLLGIDEAIMKFALKSGEDLDRDLNPAAALNKWKLKAAVTKDLYQKVGAQVSTLSKTADSIMQSAAPTSTTIRPYAIIKGVLDKYTGKAASTLNPHTAEEMNAMVAALRKEIPGSAAGTDRVMTTTEANALKRQWGESVDWSGKAPDDKMQAAFKTMQQARRDIYQALNTSIADNMGGNEGKIWLQKDHDIFNLMEAKSLIKKAAEGHASEGKHLWEAATNVARKPGPASMAAGAVRGATDAATAPGVVPAVGRGIGMGASTMFGNNQQ